MKKLFSGILILFFLNIFSQKIRDSSFIRCKYLTKFLVDTTNENSQKEEINVLLIGKNVSLFQNDIKNYSDSLKFAIIKASFENVANNSATIISPNLSSVPRYYFQQEVFTKDNQTYITDKILAYKYIYERSDKIIWKITNESKTISGYHCTKAFCIYGARKITAWFTKSIPLSEGPYNFKGLPGLIVELYDEKKYFYFSLTYLKKEKKDIVFDKNAYISTDYEKFAKKRREIQNDPVGNFNHTSKIPLPQDMQERAIKNIKSKNNYLD